MNTEGTTFFMLKNLVTLVVSSCVSVFFVNFLIMTYNVFYLEQLSPEYILQQAVTNAGHEWDARRAGEVLRDLRHNGVNATPNFTPIGTADHFSARDYQPLGGRSHATVVMCNETGSWVTYMSDRFGFNNNDAIHDDPHVKIALLGDSYVQGYCVSRENTIGGQLNKNGFETINWGMSGNGYVSYLATFMEYIRPLRVETTVLVWFHNDLDDTQREYRHTNLRYYVKDENSKFLRTKQDKIDASLDDLISLNPYQSTQTRPEHTRFKDESVNWQSYVRGVATLSGIRSTLRSALGVTFRSAKVAQWNDDTVAAFSVMKEALTQIVETAGSWNGQVIVVALTPYGGNTPEFSMQISEMREALKGKNNLVISDFEPFYKKYGEEELYALSLNGNHFNEYGYCLFAKHVADLIRGGNGQVTSELNINVCQPRPSIAS